jgi:hypothetical protein
MEGGEGRSKRDVLQSVNKAKEKRNFSSIGKQDIHMMDLRFLQLWI